MQRYFINQPISETKVMKVTGEDAHHIVRVMRMNRGDQAILASLVTEQACQAEIVKIEANSVSFAFLKWQVTSVELPVKITIAIGLPKGDKPELIVQKGTELGAHQFIFFPAERSVVKWDEKKQEKKISRLKKIAKEAAEQSHRSVVPGISSQSFSELLTSFPHYDHVICAYEEGAKNNEKSELLKTFGSLSKGESLLAITGPEGGISEKEVDQFIHHRIPLVGLGPRILRAETTPFYILSAASFYFELIRSSN